MITLHVAIATRSFRRYSTYRAATLAGIFTNSVFGVIYKLRLPGVVERPTPTRAGTTRSMR